MKFNWKAFTGGMLNLFAVACVCYVAWNYGSRLFNAHHSSKPIHVGSQLALKDVDWSARSKRTLVMFLSTTCEYCRQSVDFYRQIILSVPPSETHIIAVFNESPEVARAYLSSVGMQAVTDVRRTNFSSVNVGLTPTLAVVDRSGFVRSLWTGYLHKQGQDEVLGAVGIGISVNGTASATSAHDAKAAALQLHSELHTNPRIAVIDIRDRPEFEVQHLAVAQNIPLDELEMRASHEVSKVSPIRIYCEYRLSCNDLTAKGITNVCDIAQAVLRDQGYTDIQTIYADLPALSGAGVSVVAGN